MKRKCITIVMLLFSTLSFSQSWVSFDGTSTPQPPDLRVLNSSNQEVLINCQNHGMNSKSVIENSITYNRIEMPKVLNSINVGNQELPVISEMIAIPECTNVTASLLNVTSFTLNNYYIYPAPEVSEQFINGQYIRTETFNINQQVYTTNSYFPSDILKIESIGYIRDQRYAQISLNPIRFNPVTRTLSVITSCDIKIQFTNPTSNVNVPTGLFNNVVHNCLINYPGDGKTANSTSPSDNSSVTWFNLTNYNQLDNLAIDYLIITANEYWDPNNTNSEIRRLARHRASTDGFVVGIINVANILDESSQVPPITNSNPYWIEQKIRNCIKKIYENNLAPNTYDHNLAYVLLVGDAKYGLLTNTSYGVPSAYDPEVIPYSSWNDLYPSDNYYSLLTIDNNGNYDPYSDVYIGRFPINNTTELYNMVEKTIKYETEFSGQQFNKKTLFTNSDVPGADLYLIHPLGVYPHFLPSVITQPYSYTIYNEQVVGMPTPDLVVDEVNNGVFLWEYYGHSHIDFLGYTYPLYISELQNQLKNDYMTPFFFANSCEAGSFDGHQFSQECLAEILTRYSSTKGVVGSLAASAQAILNSNSSIPNGLYPRSTFDAIPYFIFEQASSITGEFLLQTKNFVQSTNILPGYKMQPNFYFNYFGDPALNLMADGYLITHDISLNGEITISTDVHVCQGATLTISGTVNFAEKGRLIIDKGGNLILAGNCIFKGKEAYNALEINGLITVSNTSESIVNFTALENSVFTGLILNNPGIVVEFPQLNLSNSSVFGYDLISFKVGVTGSTRSQFMGSALYFQAGDVEIKNTDFTNGSYANLRNSVLNPTSGVKIHYCTFNGNNGESFINIQDYPTFDINNNTINFSRFDAISLYNSGFGIQTPHLINKNTINFVGNTYTNNNCIKVYHSQVDITNNTLTNASYGISCLNNSNSSILGTCSAPNQLSTQQIFNNRQNQIYATSKDYPYQIKFNHFDNAINSNPLVYLAATVLPVNPFLNITCNHWGSPFFPSTELYPYGKYIYNPLWNYINCFCNGSSAEESFLSAQDAELNGDLVTAKADFEEVIENYPEFEYAIASVNELYSIALYNNDLINLQNYLDTIANVDTTALSFRAEFVKNWINLSLNKYSDAINWYENRLIDPVSLEDSVFSIIDLNYIILRSLSEDSVKTMSAVRFPELVVKNQSEFEKKRSDLIDLLYLKNDKVQESILNNPIIDINVYPNPVKDILTVKFNSMYNEVITANLKLFNQLGISITSYNNIEVVPGVNEYLFDLSKITPGVYYLSLFNGNEWITSFKVII